MDFEGSLRKVLRFSQVLLVQTPDNAEDKPGRIFIYGYDVIWMNVMHKFDLITKYRFSEYFRKYMYIAISDAFKLAYQAQRMVKFPSTNRLI